MQLPGLPPFLAVLDSLDLLGDPGAGPVRYKFSFTEYRAAAPYEAEAGTRPWRGRAFGTTPGATARRWRNWPGQSQIRDVAVLEEGQEVWIP